MHFSYCINVMSKNMRCLFCGILCYSDRVRTTNNMLGDCYAAAVVEHLSKAELQSSPSHGSIVKNLGEKDVSAFSTYILYFLQGSFEDRSFKC